MVAMLRLSLMLNLSRLCMLWVICGNAAFSVLMAVCVICICLSFKNYCTVFALYTAEPHHPTMTRFTENEMAFTYAWPQLNERQQKRDSRMGPLDEYQNAIFERENGQHTLTMVNRFMERHNLRQPGEGRHVERLLRYTLPNGQYSWRWVFKWLSQHFRQ